MTGVGRLLVSMGVAPVAVFVTLLIAQGQQTAAKNGRLITVEDLARETIIGDPNCLDWDDFDPRVSTRSPNGKYDAVVLRRGNPEQGTNDAELLVFATQDLLHAPEPVVVARFASATNFQPIALVRWLSDNETLVFAGTRLRAVSQIFSVDIRTRKLRQLTKGQSQIQSYDITPSGTRLITISDPQRTPPAKDPVCMERGCLVTADVAYDAEYGETKGTAITVTNTKDGKTWPVAVPEVSHTDINSCYSDLQGGLSPDGKYGLLGCRLKPFHWPKWWNDYDYVADLPWVKSLSRGNYLPTIQWMLVDFDQGRSIKLTQAPFRVDNIVSGSPIWIDHGRRLILCGAFEPLTGVDGQERNWRASHEEILLIDPATLATERIASLDLKEQRGTMARWNERTQTLIVETSDSERQPLPTMAYQRIAAGWVASVETAASTDALAQDKGPRPSLTIEQSLNQPPLLIAVDRQTGLKRVALDPNPWLAARQLGHVEAITWTSKDGFEWRGGLIYPPDYKPSIRYPLVLQTHGFDPEKFSLDGYARNFAGQALAAHGIFVLQVDSFPRSGLDLERTPKEWPMVEFGYEGAIDHLESLGLIDRHHVGIQGWSRTGPHAAYTITHTSYSFAAAAFTSTVDIGWLGYLDGGGEREYESDYGAAPFGSGLDVWKRMAPSFNLDHVNAAWLMIEDGPVWPAWDWYAGLRRLGKPVEYWTLPDGEHDVFKVPQRILMNQLIVDWFCFWLKDEKDSDPKKVEQYSRWQELRELQEAGRESGADSTDTTP
jgi:dipeptidyl aminopeptidase/acylaminoacyl peptidase